MRLEQGWQAGIHVWQATKLAAWAPWHLLTLPLPRLRALLFTRSRFSGNVTFTYTVSDGVSPDTANATVTLVIATPNSLPVVDDAYSSDYNAPIVVSTLATGLLSNDGPSPTGGALAVSAITVNVSASAGTLSQVDLSQGTFVFTPVRGFRGPATFKYSESCGMGAREGGRWRATRASARRWAGPRLWRPGRRMQHTTPQQAPCMHASPAKPHPAPPRHRSGDRR